LIVIKWVHLPEMWAGNWQIEALIVPYGNDEKKFTQLGCPEGEKCKKSTSERNVCHCNIQKWKNPEMAGGRSIADAVFNDRA